MIQEYFSGRKCAEFDRKGSIVQENVYNCSNSRVSCPNVYKSTDAYKCKNSLISIFALFFILAYAYLYTRILNHSRKNCHVTVS